jgi:hypothetical protein
MKLADRTVETHSAGVKSEAGFTIAQTSKMFKILSDSLYSDKVMAVVRELSTNAYDSHIAAGNKNPFKVVLPSAGNPNFVVRDYGTGLSQTDMENLYTTYGASNKNTSNDFVGCLGLGSKSPFAYTKSFTTSSYYNGQKYTYVAAIDDSGVPTLNLFSVSETDEPNGLEISFAVKQYDFAEFSSKSMRIFHYFKMKPIIEGGVLTNLKDHKYSNKNIILSGDGWRVCRLNSDTNYYPNVHHHIDSGIVALMGNIAYPVKASQIIGDEKQTTNDAIQRWNRAFQKADIDSWKSFVNEIINQNLYLELDFGIGELEMDVSREGLQYTKDVIRTLREKTQEIYLEMKEEFSKKIAAAKTKVEAITLYYTLNDLAGGWGVGAEWTDSKGKKHNINSGQDLEYKIPAGKSMYVFNYRTAGYRSRRMVYQTNSIHHNTLTGQGEYYWNNQKKTGELSFFVCDIKTEETAKKIVTRYCNDNNCFAYLMIDTKDHTKADEGFDSLIADVGADKIKKVSDYKDLIKSNNPRKQSSRSSNGAVSDQDVFFIYGESKDSGKISNPYNDAPCLRVLTEDELEAFEDSDEIIYVPIIRYASASNEYPSISDLNLMINDVTATSLVKDLFGSNKIYAIKSAFVDKLKKQGYTLIDFNTFFKKQLKRVAKDSLSKLSEYNGIVEFSRTQDNYSAKNSDTYYGYGTLEKQFTFHMLNIFGLDYEKHISNKKLVDAINYCLIIEFFVDTVHRPSFDIKRFKAADYFGHMTRLLSDIGINGLDSQKVRNSNIAYNSLVSYIQSRMYIHNEDMMKECIAIIKPDVSKKYNLAKMEDVRKDIKAELDNNPVLKYIVGSRAVSGELRELSGSNEPIKQLDDRHYYSGNTKTWLTSLNDVEAFRKQIGSLVK